MLIGSWSLNNSLVDSSKNKYNLTPTIAGSVSYDYGTGGLALSGISGSGMIKNNATLMFKNAFSVSFNLKIKNVNSSLTGSVQLSLGTFAMIISTNGISARVSGSSIGIQCIDGSVLSQYQNKFIRITFVSGKLYINNTLVSTVTIQPETSSSAYTLYFQNTSNGNILISDVKLYDNNLTASEISGLIPNNILGIDSEIIHYDFDESNSSIVYDKSGFGINGLYSETNYPLPTSNNTIFGNNCATIANDKAIDFSTAFNTVTSGRRKTGFSISFWYKKTSESNWRIMKGQNESNFYVLSSTINNRVFQHSGVGNSVVTYVDGVQSNTAPSGIGWHFYAVTGLDFSTWTNFYISNKTSGSIADFRMFYTTLSASDVKKLYEIKMYISPDNRVHNFFINTNAGEPWSWKESDGMSDILTACSLTSSGFSNAVHGTFDGTAFSSVLYVKNNDDKVADITLASREISVNQLCDSQFIQVNNFPVSCKYTRITGDLATTTLGVVAKKTIAFNSFGLDKVAINYSDRKRGNSDDSDVYINFRAGDSFKVYQSVYNPESIVATAGHLNVVYNYRDYGVGVNLLDSNKKIVATLTSDGISDSRLLAYNSNNQIIANYGNGVYSWKVDELINSLKSNFDFGSSDNKKIDTGISGTYNGSSFNNIIYIGNTNPVSLQLKYNSSYDLQVPSTVTKISGIGTVSGSPQQVISTPAGSISSSNLDTLQSITANTIIDMSGRYGNEVFTKFVKLTDTSAIMYGSVTNAYTRTEANRTTEFTRIVPVDRSISITFNQSNNFSGVYSLLVNDKLIIGGTNTPPNQATTFQAKANDIIHIIGGSFTYNEARVDTRTSFLNAGLSSTGYWIYKDASSTWEKISASFSKQFVITSPNDLVFDSEDYELVSYVPNYSLGVTLLNNDSVVVNIPLGTENLTVPITVNSNSVSIFNKSNTNSRQAILHADGVCKTRIIETPDSFSNASILSALSFDKLFSWVPLNKTTFDYSRKGHHAIIKNFGGSLPFSSQGKISGFGALQLPLSSSAIITLTDSFYKLCSSNFTISLWVRTNNIRNYNTMFINSSTTKTSSPEKYRLNFSVTNNGKTGVVVFGNNTVNFTLPSQMNNLTWTNFIIVFSRNSTNYRNLSLTIKLYENGTIASPSSSNVSDNLGFPTTLYCQGSTSSEISLQDFRIYDRELSGNEITVISSNAVLNYSLYNDSQLSAAITSGQISTKEIIEEK